jgi:hypothetical protein
MHGLFSLLTSALLLSPVLFAQQGSANAQGAQKPRVVSSFTAEAGARYPFRQNMYRALLLGDGRLVAVSIARENRQQTMQGRYSTDNGQTWSRPADLFKFPIEAGGFGLFEAMVDQEGEIHIFFLCDANSGVLFPKEGGGTASGYGTLEIWHVRSKDKLKGWGALKRIREGRNSDLLSVTQLSSGRIVLPICFATGKTWRKRGEGFPSYTYMGGFSSGSMYSDDNGQTWHDSPDVLSVQTPDMQTYGAVEPVVIQLKDGRVWMLMRTQRGRFYESFSKDGARWSPPQPSPLISSDSPAGLIRLKDGSLMLFSNACLRYPYAYGARYVLHGAISRDEGRTWQGFREVVRDPHRDEPPTFQSDYGVSYVFPTLTADGLVLFSAWVEQGNIRRFRLVDPAWLLETRQESDFSQGFEEWSIFGSRGVEVQPDPEKNEAKVLALRKADPDWPAGAVWNFPVGSRGRLRLQLKLRSGFGGALLGLTDHFSVPWDLEDTFYNVFNLSIAPSGELLPGVKLAPERWYEMEFNWDTNGRKCSVLLDGKPAGTIEDNRRSSGMNYLRLRSTSERTDGGLVIRRVSADVSGSWQQ